MTITTAPTAQAAPGVARLTWLHLKYQFLETVRIPVAVFGNLLFPALAMFFFVVPQEQVAGDPVIATMAIAGLAFFAVCSASLFTYGLGVAEDPATGGASGPLGCYLLHHRIVTHDQATQMLSHQGVAMGRPSRVHISIENDAGTITRVRVGGVSVMVGDGYVEV